MQPTLTITTEPLDDLRRKFVLDREIAPRSARKFRDGDDVADVPVAAAVLAVPGVCEVVVAGVAVTVVQDGSCSWAGLEPQVRYALERAAAVPAVVASTSATDDDDEMYDVVQDLFRVEINPAVAQHGGRVDLLDVQDGTVVVRMMGGCQGCGMATVTLRQGIEATLKRRLPAVKGVKDVTDHSSGANPYFSASTK
jgi:Fe-S cluster biogenesis protein NfuA